MERTRVFRMCIMKNRCALYKTLLPTTGVDLYVGLRAYEDSMPVVLKCKIT